jgi:uncharacterized protein (UPF0332 family)
MRKPAFLNRLKEEGKLRLTEPSEDMCLSYIDKSENCIRSAKLLLQNKLHENSIAISYYAMYDSLSALLAKAGIKCESHAGSIFILGSIFEKADLSKAIHKAKRKRVDKQYYVSTEKDAELEGTAKGMFLGAESFVVEMKLLINSMNTERTRAIRDKLRGVLGG